MSLVDTDRYKITYNGEVYNFELIKSELQRDGFRFRSNSDTEVILAAYAKWGKRCVEKFNGMFAFAIWDRLEKELLIFRDRYGIKPVYYYKGQNKFVFASEQKAILACLNQKPSINLNALHQYFTFQNILNDQTFYQDIFLLEPGSILRIKSDQNSNFQYDKEQYWDFKFESQKVYDVREYQEELVRLVSQSLERHLVSDVEIGSYLSGGMDSGTITALAASSIDDLKTFTCGFDISDVAASEAVFDERRIAEKISAKFGTEHYEYIVSARDIERTLNQIVFHLEEPRVGQSYPNYCAARLASKFTKVCLSGAGGDELFAGYPWRYQVDLLKGKDEFQNHYYKSWQRLTSADERKKLFLNPGSEDLEVKLKKNFTDVFGEQSSKEMSWDEKVNSALYFEAKTFLHSLLIVEDKLSMAHSLETRVPFLDNQIVEFAQKCPIELKLKRSSLNGTVDENDFLKKKSLQETEGKVILRHAMKKILSADISELRKQGFSSPDASWFRGESLNFIKTKISDKQNPLYDILDVEIVSALVDEHLKGEKNRRLLIWSLLYCCELFSPDTNKIISN